MVASRLLGGDFFGGEMTSASLALELMEKRFLARDRKGGATFFVHCILGFARLRISNIEWH